MSFFPVSVPTSLELLDARNNRTVTLTAGVNDSVTTIPVADTSLIPTSGYVTATDGSAEAIHYTGVTASSLTGCTRGADGTTASSHGSGGTLGMWGNAAYHNILKEEVIAIAQNLSDRIGLHATQVILQDDLDANSFKVTGLAAGTTNGDAVRYEQVLLLSGGTLTGPLLITDGSVGAPSIAFSDDTGTGIYSTGNGEIAFANNGTAAWKFDVNGDLMNIGLGHVFHGSGNAAGPSVSFNSDTNTGLYLIGADHMGIATGGLLRWQVDSSGNFAVLSGSSLQMLAAQGTAGAPSYSFNLAGSTDTGMFLASADTLAFSSNGTSRLTITTTVNPLAAILSPDGSAASPTYSFTSDTDTGVYLVSANTLGFTTGGVIRALITSTEFSIQSAGVQIEAAAGSVSAPGFAFQSDVNTGIYNSSADQLDFATGGVQRFAIAASGLISSLGKHEFTGGSAAAPAISFSADPNTGIYNIGADSIGFTTNGVLRVTIDNSGLTVNSGTLSATFTFADGSAAAPSITFGSDLDTGLYRTSADRIGISTGGVERFVQNNSFTTVKTGQLTVPDGSAAAPAFTFENDLNTGFYRIGADSIGFTTNGTLRWQVTSTGDFAILGGGAAQMLVGQGTAALPSYSFNVSGGTDCGMYLSAADVLNFAVNGTSRFQIENSELSANFGGVQSFKIDASVTAGQTRLLIYDVDNATIERVTVGAADSGGSGFKLLRIPN